MQMPNVRNVLRDPTKQINYEVMAYRALSEQELLMAVRVYLSNTKKSKRPKPGQTVTIYSVIT
jgi:hypothetical protein